MEKTDVPADTDEPVETEDPDVPADEPRIAAPEAVRVQASARLSTDEDDAAPAAAAERPAVQDTPVLSKAVPATPAPVSTHVPDSQPADDNQNAVVDIPISPGADRFINTMSECGSAVGNLGNKDLSEGMLELSHRSTTEMKRCYGVFKRHTLDVAVTIFKAAPSEEGRMRSAVRKTEVFKLLALPAAAVYGMMAVLCAMFFAVFFYGPVAWGKAKSKMIEWRAGEHAAVAAGHAASAATIVQQSATSAYEAAASTSMAKQGGEYLEQAQKHASTAYVAAASVAESVAANSVVQAVASKGSEAADGVRSKVSEQLGKMSNDAADDEAKTAPASV